MATNITSMLYSPIIEKIDPYHMYESVRNAELSTKYGARLLQMKMSKNKKEAVTISGILVNNYSYHGYAITLDEAEEIGLNVFNLNQLIAWKEIHKIYNATQNNDIIGISSKEANDNQGEEEDD